LGGAAGDWARPITDQINRCFIFPIRCTADTFADALDGRTVPAALLLALAAATAAAQGPTNVALPPPNAAVPGH
jgi:hypothetical protein